MLAYILAIAVGCGGFALYMAAFFFPEVHRKYDFLWSGVAMFYALVLWACAGRITGGVLLGQFASVALLGWFGWQTLALRRDLTPSALQTQADLQTWRSQLQHVQEQVQANLQRRSQTLPRLLPELSAWATVSERLTELVTNTRAVVRGIWETSRRSLPTVSKPTKPSRPTLVRSPSAKKARASKATPSEERKEKTEESKEKTDLVSLTNEAEGAIGNPHLANPNDSLELWEDDFEEDIATLPSTPPEAIAPDPVLEDVAGLGGDELLESTVPDSTDGLADSIVDDSIGADPTADASNVDASAVPDASVVPDAMTAIASEIVTEPLIQAEPDETPVPNETENPLEW